MASTTFSSGTVVTSVWLNDVNSLVWTAFGGATTAATAATALSLGTASTASFAGVRVGDGTAASPSYSFTNETSTGFFRPSTSAISISIGGAEDINFFRGSGGASIVLQDTNGTNGYFFSPSSPPSSANADTKLIRDAAAVVAMRSGAVTQTFRLYNTFTDASNYERLAFLAGSGIVMQNAGTGSIRALQIGVNNGAQWQVATSGHFTAVTDNANDVGDTTHRPRSVYAGTSVIIAGQAYTANGAIAALTFIIDGAGAVPTTGVKGDLLIPFACTINSATLQADQSGSAVVDIWKKTYTTSSPPTVANTITASALPTLSTAQSSQDATLTGWTTAIAANDMLRFNLNSVTICTRLTLTLKVTKT